jgi:DnaJ-class molecular chaperone
MNDPYKVLGVEKSADDKAIKANYKSLSKKYHPDLNSGDKKCEEKFKELSSAYDILSNPEKREAYDNGMLDSSGNQRQHRHSGFNQYDMNDVMGDMFRQSRGGGSFRQRRPENPDETYPIKITFMDAVKGVKKTIKIPTGNTLDITIPKGIKEGQKLRLKGQGSAQYPSEPRGDVYIEIYISEHSYFKRKGNDIYVDVPISLDESILGKTISVPTIDGFIDVTLSKGVNSGTSLCLKGKGVLGGDEYIQIEIVMPKTIDSDLENAILKWSITHPYNPRYFS